MSTADMRKEGSEYDLTLAMGILVATGQIKETNPLENYIIMGELSLDGNLQHIRGALPIAIKAKKEGFKGFILPKINAKEAAIVEGIDVYGVDNIKEVINYIDKGESLEITKVDIESEFNHRLENPEFDFADVKCQ